MGSGQGPTKHLDHILQLLQCLPGTGNTQVPETIPTAPESQTPETPANPIPQAQACSLKPSPPNDFDGDHLWGQAFLNSCQLHIFLCEEQFKDEQAKIHWALSFMKSGHAALHANHIL
jgi:hypothetical protein